MSYTMKQMLLNTDRYLTSPTRSLADIKYIVVHEAHESTESECHFNVLEEEVIERIPINFSARHCNHALDKTSIGVGIHDFSEKGLDNAACFIKTLMKQYNISIFNILRHYDVTGEKCPRIFVEKQRLWDGFINRIQSSPTGPFFSKERVKAKVTAVSGLNLRKSMDGSKLTSIPFGDEVVVLIKDVGEEGGYMWSKVIYHSYTGYCASKYLSL